MKLSERLALILKNEELSQKELAKIIGVTSQSVSNWMQRESISKNAALIISEKLGYDYEWILNDKKSKLPESKDARYGHRPEQESWSDHAPSDIEVPLLSYLNICPEYYNDIINGLEHGNDYFEYFSVPDFVFKRKHCNSENAIAAEFQDNSMHPVISQQGIYVVATDRKEIINGKIYAIYISGATEGVTRRLYLLSDGSVMLKPDNNDFPEEIVSKEKISVLGEVIYSANIL